MFTTHPFRALGVAVRRFHAALGLLTLDKEQTLMFKSAIFTVALLLAGSSSASAATIVSIFNNLASKTGNGTIAYSTLFDTFSTGTKPFELTAVSLMQSKVSSTDSGTWYLYLATFNPTDASWKLISRIYVGNERSLTTSPKSYTYTLSTPVLLNSSSNYAIALDFMYGTTPPVWWETTNTSGVGVAGQYWGKIDSDDGTLSYFADSAGWGAFQMRLDGFTVPEPSTSCLAGFALMILGSLLRQRHSA
jgi:hypothetical protein